MIHDTHQPMFTSNPASPGYNLPVELPCYVIEAGEVELYRTPGAQGNELRAQIRHEVRQAMLAPGWEDVTEIVAYASDTGRRLYVYTRDFLMSHEELQQ